MNAVRGVKSSPSWFRESPPLPERYVLIASRLDSAKRCRDEPQPARLKPLRSLGHPSCGFNQAIKYFDGRVRSSTANGCGARGQRCQSASNVPTGRCRPGEAAQRPDLRRAGDRAAPRNSPSRCRCCAFGPHDIYRFLPQMPRGRTKSVEATKPEKRTLFLSGLRPKLKPFLRFIRAPSLPNPDPRGNTHQPWAARQPDVHIYNALQGQGPARTSSSGATGNDVSSPVAVSKSQIAVAALEVCT